MSVGSTALRRLRVDERSLVLVSLCLVLLAGGWLRLAGANWDEGDHLHPDERYLSIVADNIRWPGSFLSYLDVHTSPLSPYNTTQGRDDVYGTFPLFATKAVATAFGDDEYGRYYLVGRRLSGLVDLATVVVTFLLGRLLLAPLGERRAAWGGLFAATLYAFTVTAIQLSHFATVESWLVLFGTLTLYLAARAVRRPLDGARPVELAWILVGIALGLTVASKISGGVVAAAVAIALLGRATVALRVLGRPSAALRLAASSIAVAVPGYLAYRLVSPYAFANSFWLDFSINPLYRSAVAREQDALHGTFLFPPAYQWLLSQPIWDPLRNLAEWQLGLPLAAVAAVGVGLLACLVALPVVRAVRRRELRLPPSEKSIEDFSVRALLLAFLVAGFFPFATLFAHTGRYLVPLAPVLAVAASFGLAQLLGPHRPALLATAGLIVALTAAYALAFHAIYAHPTTRVAASKWIVAHVPAGATIANEHWDDSLPVGGDAQRFAGRTVPVFDPDDGSKLRKLYDALGQADYYFLSSPRAWRTIGRLPDRFPLMVRFYRTLFAGRLGFTQVASFRSVPRLLGVELDDLDAEEAFWVYDHPLVRIFRHTRRLTFGEFRRVLCAPATAPSPACP